MLLFFTFLGGKFHTFLFPRGEFPPLGYTGKIPASRITGLDGLAVTALAS